MPRTKKAPVEMSDKFWLVINAFVLTGERTKGVWTWDCPDWPELVPFHTNEISPSIMAAVFTMAALKYSRAQN